jgi:uncharacterized protein
MHSVGTIIQLAHYPVKSMRGQALPATALTFQGLPHDRRYAFVQKASRSDFPWLTARQHAELLRYRPAVEQEGSGDATVTVSTPGGQSWPVDSDELRRELEARSGRELFLLRQERGSYDVAPISILSRQSVVRIAEESATQENFRRFRPNLVIDLQEGDAFEELRWVGRVVRVGDVARVAITEVDRRCVIITLDPETGQPSPSILQSVTHKHQRCAGVYATVLTPGDVRLGDAVGLET